MIDYTTSYTVDWHVYRVDPDTWDEVEELGNVVSVTVNRDCTDEVPLLESSSMSFDADVSDEFDDGWYRVVAIIYQGPLVERVPICTHYYAVSDETYDYGVKTYQLEGQSVLVPAADLRMRNGSFVPKNTNGAKWVGDYLRRVLKSPVHVDPEGFSLKRHVVYDENDTVLSAIWGVLDAGKWCMQIDGNGIVNVIEKPKEPDMYFAPGSLRILHPTVKRTKTRAGIPNRYIVRDNGQEVVAVNDDPTSDSSVQSVGHYIDAPLDNNPYLLTGESLKDYAYRKLEEASTVSITYDYTREYHPDVFPLSIIRTSVFDLGMDGDLRVAKQQLTLDQGIYLSETATQEFKYWSRARQREKNQGKI